MLSVQRLVSSPARGVLARSLQTSSWWRKDITSNEEFESAVLKAAKPIVVDFHAPWCMPCKQFTPVLEKVIKETDGEAELVKVDIDELGELAMEHNVTSIPNIILFSKGKEVARKIGAIPEADIKAAITELITSHKAS